MTGIVIPFAATRAGAVKRRADGLGKSIAVDLVATLDGHEVSLRCERGSRFVRRYTDRKAAFVCALDHAEHRRVPLVTHDASSDEGVW